MLLLFKVTKWYAKKRKPQIDRLLCTLPGQRPGIAKGNEQTRLCVVHFIMHPTRQKAVHRRRRWTASRAGGIVFLKETMVTPVEMDTMCTEHITLKTEATNWRFVSKWAACIVRLVHNQVTTEYCCEWILCNYYAPHPAKQSDAGRGA